LLILLTHPIWRQRSTRVSTNASTDDTASASGDKKEAVGINEHNEITGPFRIFRWGFYDRVEYITQGVEPVVFKLGPRALESL